MSEDISGLVCTVELGKSFAADGPAVPECEQGPASRGNVLAWVVLGAMSLLAAVGILFINGFGVMVLGLLVLEPAMAATFQEKRDATY